MSVHFFVITGDFWYASVLVGTATRLSQVLCKHSWGSCTLVWMRAATGRPRQHKQRKNCLPRHARPHGPRVSGEWVGTCWAQAHVSAGVQSVDLAKCVDMRGSLQRHILGDAVQSGFRGSHTGSRFNRWKRAVQHGAPHTVMR